MFGTGLFAPIYRRYQRLRRTYLLPCSRPACQRKLRTLPRPLRPRVRIALVGNGPVDPAAAGAIDAHDLVVRFNTCTNYGASGRRVDVLVLGNDGHTGAHLANAPDAIPLEAWAAAREFWLRVPGSVLQRLAMQWPEGRENWVDHTEAILRNRVGARPWRAISEQVYWTTHEALKRHGALDAHLPSTGILALSSIRHCMGGYRPVVTLFGFTHEGWEGHAWAAERASADAWSGRYATTALSVTRRQLAPSLNAGTAPPVSSVT